MKETIDRQLVKPTSLTPFMSVRDGFNKRVAFNMTDGIEQKIDKLTVMMGKLVTGGDRQDKPFKPQVYQSNRDRCQNRGNYNQRGYQGRFRSNNAHIQDIFLTIEVDMKAICKVIKVWKKQ